MLKPTGSSKASYDAGFAAGLAGKSHDENPHIKHGRFVPGTTVPLSSWWSSGWHHGNDKRKEAVDEGA